MDSSGRYFEKPEYTTPIRIDNEHTRALTKKFNECMKNINHVELKKIIDQKQKALKKKNSTRKKTKA